MHDFHQTGYDPWELMIKITHQLDELTQAHNRLAVNHEHLQRVITEIHREIQQLQNFQQSLSTMVRRD